MEHLQGWTNHHLAMSQSWLLHLLQNLLSHYHWLNQLLSMLDWPLEPKHVLLCQPPSPNTRVHWAANVVAKEAVFVVMFQNINASAKTLAQHTFPFKLHVKRQMQCWMEKSQGIKCIGYKQIKMVSTRGEWTNQRHQHYFFPKQLWFTCQWIQECDTWKVHMHGLTYKSGPNQTRFTLDSYWINHLNDVETLTVDTQHYFERRCKIHDNRHKHILP